MKTNKDLFSVLKKDSFLFPCIPKFRDFYSKSMDVKKTAHHWRSPASSTPVACSLRSGRFFDHDFSNQRDGYTTSENTLVEKSYFSIDKIKSIRDYTMTSPFQAGID